MRSRGARRLAELLFATVIFAAISLWTAHEQKPARVFGDARQYYRMEKEFETGQPVIAAAPFVFRIGTPWVAAVASPFVYRVTPSWLDKTIEVSTGMIKVTPFYLVNIAGAFAALILLIVYLRHFVESAGIRLLLATMWMCEWWAPARYVYFYPANVEPLFIVFLLAALLLIEGTRDRPSAMAVTLLALLAFVGTLLRESAILVAVVFACHRLFKPSRGRSWLDVAFALVPLLTSILALACTRLVGTPTGPYAPWAEPLKMLQQKPLFTWVLAWFFTFGPASLALIALNGPQGRELLRSRPYLAVFLAGCGVLAFLGGTDTERILGWAAPVVYVLVGRAIERTRTILAGAPALVCALGLAQIVSERILWTIPIGADNTGKLSDLDVSWASASEVFDRLFVVSSHYGNLWSFWGSRILHGCILAFDVSLVIVVAIVVRRRASRLAVRPRSN